jgi:hypothetical protein
MINHLDTILRHDRIVIPTELNSKVNSKPQLDRLLGMFMNYIGEDNYIEHNDDCDMFEDFLILNKNSGKWIISTTLNVWLSNTHITDSIFDDVKFILPYKNLMKLGGLPHFPGNRSAIPTRLLLKSDLVMSLSNNSLNFDKARYYYSDLKLDLQDLFIEERNMKIRKLKTLI